MTKDDIVATMAYDADISKRAAKDAYDSLVGIILGEVSGGNNLRVPDIGTFKVVDRKARKGRNPKTGAVITIPARKALTFSAAKSLKDAARG
jgi:DNA-binding protein HU-beta